MRVLLVVLVSAIVGTAVGGTIAWIEAWADDDAIGAIRPSQAIASQSPSTPTDPRAEIDESVHYFGAMERGTTRAHSFVVKNAGTAPLILRVGQTSCKCTVGQVDNEPVPPGGSIEVQLEWSAKSDSGPFRQTATLITNDPLNPQIQLTVDGEVTAASSVYPADLVFDKVQVGESKSAEVFVMAMIEDELQISDAEFSDPALRDYFEVELEPVDRDELPRSGAKDGVRVRVTAKPGLPIGRFHQWLSLQTNLRGAESLEIPLAGRVVGDISVHGPGWNEEHAALQLGSIRSSTGGTGRLNLVVRGEGASEVRFAVATVDPQELEVSIGEPRALRDNLLHVPLEVVVPQGMRPMVRLDTAQGEAGHILLKTNHPIIPELKLGVRFAVER